MVGTEDKLEQLGYRPGEDTLPIDEKPITAQKPQLTRP